MVELITGSFGEGAAVALTLILFVRLVKLGPQIIYFVEKIVPQIEKSSSEGGAEAIKYIAKAIPQLSQVADTVSTTDRILQSLATLAHLYDSRKFLLPGKEEAGVGRDIFRTVGAVDY